MKALLCLFLLASAGGGFAATIRIDYKNGAGYELRDAAGTPLTQGEAAVDQDGAVLQVGYYSLATSSNPFAGEWVPMIGPALFDPFFATIGDKGGMGAGLFSRDGGFGDTPAGFPDFPLIGTPLSIRFYDATSLAGAAHFNAVSSASWTWTGPGDPENVIAMNLTDSVLLWQDGIASAFRTTIPVPEPSACFLAGVSVLGLMWRRRPALVL